jgi:23S rRNA (pseudouridine1915-N3)-methyltransferase
MKTTLVAVGKTNDAWIKQGISVYMDRLKHYLKFEYHELEDVKIKSGKPDFARVSASEGEKVLKFIEPGDHVVLFDENGKEFSSEGFADWFVKRQNASPRQLIFLIGGAYGFSPEVRSRANEVISLSQMTFSHQMVRVFAIEQIYRAQSIIKGEPYHHR